MEHSFPYTPQHNGVVERKNGSLKEMETFLLHAKHLPPLWAKAIDYALYLQNRVPHKLVVGATPFEALLGHKPDVSHSRVLVPKLGAEFLWTRERPSKPRVVNAYCWDMLKMKKHIN